MKKTLKCACVSVPCKDLPAPSSLAEALQQRMDIYKSAAEGAKSKGDDRKARMHQRIVKVHTMQFRNSDCPILTPVNSPAETDV